MQIGALGTILYASLVDLLCFLQPFLKTEGDVLAMAETVSAPFAGCLHFVARLRPQLAPPSLAVATGFLEAKILPRGMDAVYLAAWYSAAMQTALPSYTHNWKYL